MAARGALGSAPLDQAVQPRGASRSLAEPRGGPALPGPRTFAAATLLAGLLLPAATGRHSPRCCWGCTELEVLGGGGGAERGCSPPPRTDRGRLAAQARVVARRGGRAGDEAAPAPRPAKPRDVGAALVCLPSGRPQCTTRPRPAVGPQLLARPASAPPAP